MGDILSKGTLFPEELVPELINLVKGKSALAALSAQKPISFNGQKEFTFTFDNEIDVVAENGAKTKGGVTISPVTIIPIKVEYGARISDEFVHANEKIQLDYLQAFSEGFARKVARGIDLMAFHGINPRTKATSAVIGSNHFDSKITNVVDATNSPDADIESAIELIQENEYDVSGLAIAPVFRSALSKEKDATGRKLYPDLAWGNAPGNINGISVASNSTVSFNNSSDRAIIGDFQNCFKWGFAKEIPIEIIEYGNPDNDATLGDLKGHNQIYIRGEMYVGWGILVPEAFAMIKKPDATPAPTGQNDEDDE